jgi:hypothetical protein
VLEGVREPVVDGAGGGVPEEERLVDPEIDGEAPRVTEDVGEPLTVEVGVRVIEDVKETVPEPLPVSVPAPVPVALGEGGGDAEGEAPGATVGALVPVPLHRRRKLWRHFNQAEEIARALGRATGLPLCPALARIRATGSQVRLTRAQRLSNLRGAFELSRAGAVFAATKPPGAVVVDDVFTTGATTDECARVLRRAGVQKVVVVTVMRG